MGKTYKHLRTWSRNRHGTDLSDFSCLQHPDYQPIHQPKGKCRVCWDLYRLTQTLEEEE